MYALPPGTIRAYIKATETSKLAVYCSELYATRQLIELSSTVVFSNDSLAKYDEHDGSSHATSVEGDQTSTAFSCIGVEGSIPI